MTSIAFKKLEQWVAIKNRPFLISGPCSAESHSQIINTAEALASSNIVSVFRAGVWKPRTRYKSFEGHGEKALSWLYEVKERTNLPVAVEVASPKHVELCLKYDIDILWIGARTVANPFSIQELAKSLKNTKIPVMIKNPINPDLQLWIGAIERIHSSGIQNIAVIHRGFNTWEKSSYRNSPLWEIPVELKRLFPEVPIICDPSHITGDAGMIEKIAQNAIDLDMDGLMIESHINPETALSDKNQQITPEKLKEIISNLKLRKSEKFEKTTAEKLEKYREKIDLLDYKLLETLSERMKVVGDIGHLKKDKNITILQIGRWNDIIQDRKNAGLKLGLDEDFLKELLSLVHKESINVQKRIMKL